MIVIVLTLVLSNVHRVPRFLVNKKIRVAALVQSVQFYEETTNFSCGMLKNMGRPEYEAIAIARTVRLSI